MLRPTAPPTSSINSLLERVVLAAELIPFLPALGFADVMAADWALLSASKFDSPIVRNWLKNSLDAPPGPFNRARAEAVSTFMFPRDAVDLQPIHMVIQNQNVHLFDLLLSYKAKIDPETFDLSYSVSKRGTLNAVAHTPGNAFISYNLQEFCSVFGGARLMACYLYYKNDMYNRNGKKLFMS